MIRKKMDEDEFKAVVAERDRLKAAIIAHRSAVFDDRCQFDDDVLYEAVGDGVKCNREVGNKFEMLKNCIRFVDVRCEGGGWLTYVQIKEQRDKLLAAVGDLVDASARGANARIIAARIVYLRVLDEILEEKKKTVTEKPNVSALPALPEQKP